MKKNVILLLMPILMILLQSCGSDTSSDMTSASTDNSSYTYCSGTCRIFITSSSYDGNLGGVSGADTKCQSDANKPSGRGLYKALISGSTRHACTTAHCTGGVSENSNWILKPSTQYVRADGTTPLFTTNASGILFLTGGHNNLSNTIGTGVRNTWTGTQAYGNEWMLSDYTCNDWTSSSSSEDGDSGREDVDTYEAFGDNGNTCDSLTSLFCVEQ